MQHNNINSSDLSRFCAVIPAFNEESTIGALIAGLFANGIGSVIVVDDFSTDNTAAVAKSHGAAVLKLAINLGAWAATQAGLRYAALKNWEFVLTLDGDGQHPPEEINKLVKPLINREANLVIGSYPQRASRLRRFAWFLLRLTSGLQFEDLTSGLRAYDRQALAPLISSKASLLDFQDVGVLALLLHTNQLTAVTVSVEMIPRTNGISRIFNSWGAVAYYLSYSLVLSIAKRRGFLGSS